MAKFVEEAEDGVILFSMGISLGVNMPCQVFSNLISAFSRLRERVVFRAFPDCNITLGKKQAITQKAPGNVNQVERIFFVRKFFNVGHIRRVIPQET